MNKTLIFLTLIVLSACTIDPLINDFNKDSAPTHVPINVLAVADAIPKYEKRTRAGNPSEYKVLGKRYTVLADSKGYIKSGIASWYGTKFHGRKTANGEVYDMYAMTAAHKTLPIPSYVRVTNHKNQRSVIVRINDRGPFHDNRIIDLSYTAAVKLGIQQTGTGFVEVSALDSGLPDSTLSTIKQQNIASVFVQVGAFSNQINARQLQEQLLVSQIVNSRVQVSHNQGNALYRVQVGPLSSVSQANKVSEKLAVMGLRDTRLVIEGK